MSRFTKQLLVPWVLAAGTAAVAQVPRAFMVLADTPPATAPAGRLLISGFQQGGIVCLDLCGSSPAPGMHKSIQLAIGDATGGSSGAILLDCASVAIDTGAPTHPGNTANTVNLTNCAGSSPHEAVYAFGQTPGGAANVALEPTGNYLGEACWSVSTDACGLFSIDYLGAQCIPPFENCGMTYFAGADSSLPLKIVDDGADIDLGPPPQNDACANATPLGDPLGFAAFPYDTRCATTDGQPALCGPLDGDVWFSYTAACTDANSIRTTGGGDWAVYDAGGGCVPTPVGEIACGSSTVEAVPVQQGRSYLIRVGTDDGAATAGDLMFHRPVYCTENLPAGHPTTVAECGGASECMLPFCQSCVGCVEVAASDGSACHSAGDGLFCTIDDHCQAGVCTGGGPRPCNDGFLCTVDACDEAEDQCTHGDVNLISCVNVADCPPGADRCFNGLCECFERPDLCLNTAPGGCHDPGSQVVVSVEMGFSTQPICTAQFFLQYEPSALEFVSIAPGGGVFSHVIYQNVDESAGTIDYALGASPAQVCDGTQGPATVAVLVFNAVADCEASEICFRPHNPATKLGAASGRQVCPAGHEGLLCESLVDPCCSGPFHFDATPPTMLCPGDVDGAADCGRSTKFVTFDLPAYAWDDCDGGVPVQCTIANGNGVAVEHLLNGGGDFPPGATTITCTATEESCGNVAECVFSVINNGQNELWVDIELSPTMKQGPVVRGINLSLTDCGDVAGGAPVEVCADVEFGFPYHLPGHGSVRLEVPAANYVCLEAWDQLHGLKASCDVTCAVIDGTSVWYAAFERSPQMNGACHWLINGNLNGDPNIDVVDYAHYLACIDEFALPGAHSTCTFTEATYGLHCDINGDGIVSLADFSFIVVNFFDNDKAGCEVVCNPSATPPANAGPIGSISVRDLDRMGLGRVGRMADMDRNGVVDMTDIALYANSGGVTSTRDARPVAREGRDIKDGSSTSLRGPR